MMGRPSDGPSDGPGLRASDASPARCQMPPVDVKSVSK